MDAIAQLDLRSEEVIAAEVLAGEQARMDRALDKMWDWPVAPNVEEKYNPAHVLAMTPQFLWRFEGELDAMRWYDAVTGGALLWSPCSRWNMGENWPVFSFVIGLTFIVGFLTGAWPWQ